MTDTVSAGTSTPPAPNAPSTSNVITPVLALQLRIRWLEALVVGLRTNAKSSLPESHTPIVRRALEAQTRLDTVVSSNESLRRFIEHYDEYAHLLTPAFAVGLQQTPDAGALDALLVEMEQDVRSADRDLREIDELEKSGVTGPGKLIDHEKLQPRIRALVQAHEEDMDLAANLEQRIGVLLRRYATEVDALSELFVSWNGSLKEIEDEVTQMEKEHAERQRLGYA